MHKNNLRSFQLFFSLIDFLVINCFLFRVVLFYKSINGPFAQLKFAFFLFLINACLGLAGNLYTESRIRVFEGFLRNVPGNIILLILFTAANTFLLFGLFLGHSVLMRSFCESLLILFVNRLLYLEGYCHFKNKFSSEKKVIIIGYSSLSTMLADKLQHYSPHVNILGFCEDKENLYELSKYPILSSIEGALDICTKCSATEIYSTVIPGDVNGLYKLVNQANQNCIRFKLVCDASYKLKKGESVEYFDTIPVISFRKEPLQVLNNRVIKRLFDILFSGIVLILINSWLIPVIAILIRIESKGPVFFKQKRSGKNNKTFFCYKFRSMYVNRESDNLQAVANDKRVTKVGKFLRRTSLDEFPQFINVLLGDMSIIGPRPHMLQHTVEYSKLIGQYMVRHFIKPGITGWAQVNGFRGETKNTYQMKKRVQYDIWYMENWRLILDVKIIALTIINTLRGEKNAF